ncbi:MAG: oligosaccharide flippase family protein [Actinobacteria bacterium]|nr:oligosaccharide flippase family protein [Actinomycetota bacterium]
MKKNSIPTRNHPLFSGSAIMVLGSNSVNFLAYLYHLIMGRILGPSNYGELASMLSIIGLLGIIPASINLVVIKYISGSKNEAETQAIVSWFKRKIFLMAVLFALGVLIVSPLLSSFLHIKNIIYWFVIAVSFLFAIQTVLNRAILQGLLKFKETITTTLIENIIKLLGSILLVYLGFQVMGAMVGFALSAIIGWYLTNSYLKNYSEKVVTFPDAKKIFLFALPVALQSFSITALYSSDLILVKHFFTAHDTGIYASLSTLGKIIFFGTGPIASVMFPLISQRQSRGGKYKKILFYSIATTGAVAFILTLFYWVFPQFAISLLYGSAYLGASNLLVWFGIFISLFTLSSLLVSFNLSLGDTNVVIFPFAAALGQIIAIWVFHESLFQVVLVSTLVNALLLLSLLIYSSYKRKDGIWK